MKRLAGWDREGSTPFKWSSHDSSNVGKRLPRGGPGKILTLCLVGILLLVFAFFWETSIPHTLSQYNVGVVVALCGADDLGSLWGELSCEHHQVYLYDRCAGNRGAQIVPPDLRRCTRVYSLKRGAGAYRGVGRNEQAYLTHILNAWEHLDRTTAFLAAGQKFNLWRFRSLNTMNVSFLHLGVDQPEAGRRGPLAMGNNNQVNKMVEGLLARVGVRDAALDDYVGHGSLFAASKTRLKNLSKDTYKDLLLYVSEESATQLSCRSGAECCHCESMERVWAHLLGCWGRFTDLHRTFQVSNDPYRAPREWNEVEPRTCYVGHDGPLMQLQGTKGLFNQRSTSLTALQLAAMLNWGVILPQIYSPSNCHDLDPACYTKMQLIPFAELHDQEHFIRYVAQTLGVRVYLQPPPGYIELPEDDRPCKGFIKCRGTIRQLMDTYMHITGPYVVPPPGIAATVLDSREHAQTTRMIDSAFQAEPGVRMAAQSILDAVGKRTLLAIHLRFEDDALAANNYAGQPAVFGRRLLLSARQMGIDKSTPLVVYIASGLSIEKARRHSSMAPLLSTFPDALLVDKHSFSVRASNLTFFFSAVDYEVASQANHFVGVVTSSFADFVALRRRSLRPGPFSTVLLPALEDRQLCNLSSEHHHGHWQFELGLPFNDCTIPDPCRLLNAVDWRRYRMPEIQPTSCKIPPEGFMHQGQAEGFMHQGQAEGQVRRFSHCTGMTAATRGCRGGQPV
mmetsp:Transcript_26165/g.73309  ORF Transcript_26165/g.73309 Transcript_26165/m.73309 type:complete len:734 (-) Transcript_26165:2988-5189(-)|eukprot:CAMPEP_0117649290 /NCGR_PEP_ID=MMETSP0804-20121206/889_1 /TAXON_ID=1074897 /ORGANISM="Tetraselmis astigmatica, Strain CCMP880" /LENGTH=733 /DNA_ID=CAMNT_0005455009 /DNA_START=233 /DNA_END=2434 /DNA_ORIENTATION=+